MDSEYKIIESSEFQKYYKHVLKKYRHSFEQDFVNVLDVITKRLIIGKDNFLTIPQTEEVRYLGKLLYPIAKTRIQIKEAQRMCGRLIYLVDSTRKIIFLIDSYYKSEQENPNREIIVKAYYEYLEFIKTNFENLV